MESSEEDYEPAEKLAHNEMDSLNKSTMYYNNMKIAESYNFKNFNIKEDLESRDNFACIIVAKRNTGKSVLVSDLCYELRNKFDTVWLVSLTARLQPKLYSFIDEDHVVNSFDETRLEQIWTQQETAVLKLKKADAPDKDMPKILIIFDDIISDPKVRSSEILKKFFVMGRHLKFSFFLLNQSFTALPPIYRINCDVCIAFYLDSMDNREAFAKSYLSTKNTRLGVMIFERLTRKQYQAVVILNYITSQNTEDSVRTYTARLKLPKFKMGKNIMKSKSLVSMYPGPESVSGPTWLPRMSKGIKL